MGLLARTNLERGSLSTKTTIFAHSVNKHRSLTHQKFRKRPNLLLSMTGEKGREENPFVSIRKKLVEDARRIREELEVEEAAEKARAKAELERELMEAKNALIDDIQTTLAELPPLHVETDGSTVITSEAFAWFYDESEPLVVLNRPSYASGSSDNTIKLWNATTGECLRTLEGHGDYVRSVAFSPIDREFSRMDLERIFKEVRAMLREAKFDLSTEDGFEFTVFWNGMK